MKTCIALVAAGIAIVLARRPLGRWVTRRDGHVDRRAGAVSVPGPQSSARAELSPDQERWVAEAWARIEEGRLCELAAAVTSIPSPTGEERALAEFLAATMTGSGLAAEVQPLDEHQANARGRLAGDGTGAQLLLYAPIDTLTAGTVEADVPWIGPELRDDMRAVARVDGPYVSGLGASNPKGHAACVLAAIEAVAAAGVPLRGDLVAGFGAGGMPASLRDRDGSRDTGHGTGCAHMIESGPHPDFAVIAKPGWTVSWEEVGLAWFEISVHGTHTYVGSRHRLPFRNPIVDAATVIGELETWFARYTAAHTDGTVAPQCIVAAIDGGWRHMAAVTPATCRFTVDVRLSPRTTPDDAEGELRDALTEIVARHPGLDLECRRTVAIPGTASPVGCFVAEAAVEAWEELEGRPHEVVVANSGATDANILRARTASRRYGSACRRCTTSRRRSTSSVA